MATPTATNPSSAPTSATAENNPGRRPVSAPGQHGNGERNDEQREATQLRRTAHRLPRLHGREEVVEVVLPSSAGSKRVTAAAQAPHRPSLPGRGVHQCTRATQHESDPDPQHPQSHGAPWPPLSVRLSVTTRHASASNRECAPSPRAATLGRVRDRLRRLSVESALSLSGTGHYETTRARVRSETWQRARSRRSVPTTSAACCDRRRCSTRGPGTGPAISTTQGCGRPRTRRSATRSPSSAKRACAPRPTASSVARRGTWTSSTSSRASTRPTRSWRCTSTTRPVTSTSRPRH